MCILHAKSGSTKCSSTLGHLCTSCLITDKVAGSVLVQEANGIV